MLPDSLVSVVVPVFNAQKSIRKCLESILTQDYSEIEVLVVDDGSTDMSGLICREYAQRDQRVCILSQSNLGPASARNNGMRRASGAYLMFVDADDALKSKAISSLVAIAEATQADMVNFNFEVTDGSRIVNRRIAVGGTYPRLSYSDGRGCLKLIYRECGVANFSWAFMYKMSFLKRTRVLFPAGVYIFEDALFLNQILRLAQKVAYCQEPLYEYQVSNASESLTHRYDPIKAAQGLAVVKQIWKISQGDGSDSCFAGHGINLLFLLDSIAGPPKTAYARRVHADIQHLIISFADMYKLEKFRRSNCLKILLIRFKVYDFMMLIWSAIKRWHR